MLQIQRTDPLLWELGVGEAKEKILKRDRGLIVLGHLLLSCLFSPLFYRGNIYKSTNQPYPRALLPDICTAPVRLTHTGKPTEPPNFDPAARQVAHVHVAFGAARVLAAAARRPPRPVLPQALAAPPLWPCRRA